MDNKNGSILIVDDNEEFLIALKIFLSPYFNEIITETVPDRILFWLKQNEFDLILMDMNFHAGMHTGNEGFYWLNKIREIDGDAVILFITAFGDVEQAIRSMKEGVTDFIQKSWDEEKIISTVLSACRLGKSRKEVNRLRSRQEILSGSRMREYTMAGTESAAMKEIMILVEKVSDTDANILITGESGTGKEVLAREIHRRSARSDEIFLPVDLGSIPESLFESELFGYKKGAFTDANQHKAGRLELSSGGTLFLDEIGNLPASLQPKLLTVLQNRKVSRLGENNYKTVDFRLISATNDSIDELIEQQRFREDLLYRLRTVEIHLPPLRERPEDLPILADYYLQIYKHKYRKETLILSANALNHLQNYSWPGNIRELQHAIEKAVILTSGNQLQSIDFQLDHSYAGTDKSRTDFNLENNEKGLILDALNAFHWNMTQAARELGINRSTLYEKIRKYELKQV